MKPSVDEVEKRHISSAIKIDVIYLSWSLSLFILTQGLFVFGDSIELSKSADLQIITSPVFVPVMSVYSLLSHARQETVTL